MAVRAQSAHAVPRFFTLYMACTPCTASINHAAWVIDSCRRGFQVKSTNEGGRNRSVAFSWTCAEERRALPWPRPEMRKGSAMVGRPADG
jgi:hypothetical protein